jgi:hypothetical protein
LSVKVAPDGVVLGLEVPEESSAADAGGDRDFVDGCYVEALSREDGQREFAPVRRDW